MKKRVSKKEIRDSSRKARIDKTVGTRQILRKPKKQKQPKQKEDSKKKIKMSKHNIKTAVNQLTCIGN
jgi:hypothetical protein